MSRKGENIYKRKDNRWEGRYIKGYGEDGALKYGYVYASTYTQVKERLQKAKTNLAIGVKMGSRSKRKFDDYAAEWLQVNRHKITESTYVKYLTVVDTHLIRAFGGMRDDYYGSYFGFCCKAG